MKTLTIVSKDKIGLLADIATLLGDAAINIDMVNVDVIAGNAVISIGLLKAEDAKRLLGAAGYSVEGDEAIIVKIPDKPGELGRISTMLTKEGVHIENVKTLVRNEGTTLLAIRTDNRKKAAQILKSFAAKPSNE